jgi:hypothetical protein
MIFVVEPNLGCFLYALVKELKLDGNILSNDQSQFAQMGDRERNNPKQQRYPNIHHEQHKNIDRRTLKVG